MRNMLGRGLGVVAIAALAAGAGAGTAKAHHSDWGLPLVGGLVGGAGLTALYYHSQQQHQQSAPPAQVVQPVYVTPAAARRSGSALGDDDRGPAERARSARRQGLHHAGPVPGPAPGSARSALGPTRPARRLRRPGAPGRPGHQSRHRSTHQADDRAALSLRYHPARRRADPGRRLHGRRQGGDRPDARPARHRLHRGRLAGRQPDRRRLLRQPARACATPGCAPSA